MRAHARRRAGRPAVRRRSSVRLLHVMSAWVIESPSAAMTSTAQAWAGGGVGLLVCAAVAAGRRTASRRRGPRRDEGGDKARAPDELCAWSLPSDATPASSRARCPRPTSPAISGFGRAPRGLSRANPIPRREDRTIARARPVESDVRGDILADDARAARARLDEQLSGQLLLHRLDVADDADGAAALAQLVEGAHREFEGVGIE